MCSDTFVLPFRSNEKFLNQPYRFRGLFTWHGCVVELEGKCHAYIADETPNVIYLNTHAILQERREAAKIQKTAGPRVMVVGAVDSGKSTLCKILCNYAARCGEYVTYIDLDIGQGSITIPGVLSAIAWERPLDPEESFGSAAPIGYFYGHVSPGENPKLFKVLTQHLATAVLRRCEQNPEVNASGLIVNTCGWVEGVGYELLLHSIDVFTVDVVLVIDHERLYSDLTTDVKTKLKSQRNIEIVKLPKSGGVVPRDPTFRRKTRMNRIREYFYGKMNELSPHSLVFDFQDLNIYKVGGGPQAPSSALPLGAEPTIDPIRLVEQFPSLELLHSVLGVSHAQSIDKLLETNIAGFVYVTDVNMERRKLTVLSPSPGILPSRYLLLGSLKWLE